MPHGPPGIRNHEMHSWDLLVHKTSITVDAGPTQFYIPLVQLPIALTSSSADNIASALNPADSVITPANLSKYCECVILTRCADAASANTRLFSWELATMPPNALWSGMYCNLHQVHIISGTILGSPTFVDDLSRMYSGALLMRAGAHWSNLLTAISTVVNTSITRIHVASLDAIPSSSPIIQDMLYLTCHTFNMSSTSSQELRHLLNGGDITTHQFVHYCVPGCCSSDSHYATRLTTCIKSMLFSKKPQVPILARWTKAGPCIDFFLFGSLLHSLLVRAVQLSTTTHPPTRARRQPAQCPAIADHQPSDHDMDLFEMIGDDFQKTTRYSYLQAIQLGS